MGLYNLVSHHYQSWANLLVTKSHLSCFSLCLPCPDWPVSRILVSDWWNDNYWANFYLIVWRVKWVDSDGCCLSCPGLAVSLSHQGLFINYLYFSMGLNLNEICCKICRSAFSIKSLIALFGFSLLFEILYLLFERSPFECWILRIWKTLRNVQLL